MAEGLPSQPFYGIAFLLSHFTKSTYAKNHITCLNTNYWTTSLMDILPKQFYLETRVLFYSLWSILIFIQYVSYLFLMVDQKIFVLHISKRNRFLLIFLNQIFIVGNDQHFWMKALFMMNLPINVCTHSMGFYLLIYCWFVIVVVVGCNQ